jgi:hypothetical protein
MANEILGFVYKWTHMPSKQYYIGIHKGSVDDGYIGSGLRFKRKRLTTNSTEWHREILFIGEYYTDCIKVESTLVNETILSDPLCLNLQ